MRGSSGGEYVAMKRISTLRVKRWLNSLNKGDMTQLFLPALFTEKVKERAREEELINPPPAQT